MKHDHLLVIRFSALGDVAMTVPVIWALAQEYPDMRITVLSRNSSRPFFEGLAPNVNFMGADIKGEYHGIKGLNALYRRLVAKQFTCVADLHGVLRSNYLRFRFRLGHYRVEHIDKHRHQRHLLVAPGKKKRLKPLPTSFQNYVDVFTRLGLDVDLQKHHFTTLLDPNVPLASPVNSLLMSQPAGPRIGIAPFAAHKGKIYPIERTYEVIERLVARYPDCRIYLFGRGVEEEKVFNEWTKQTPHCIFAGSHVEDMHQELELMSRLDVMLTMDSANMHMASLVGTKVVSVWGATHPLAGFMGWNQSEANAVQIADLDCRPCSIYGNKPCLRGDYACLNRITPDMIVEKIVNIINP